MMGSSQPRRSQETSTRAAKPTIRVDDPPCEETNRDEVEGGPPAPARRKIPKRCPAAEPEEEAVDAPSTPRAPRLPPARR
jgi:hypothetical protein